jgi:hypothetical protein
MNDILTAYTITLAFASVIMAFLCVYRYFLGNKLDRQANKLKSQIANIRRDYPELSENRAEIVEKSIEGMGIEGIIDSLGLPAILKPFAKGLIDSYLKDPEKLKGLAAKIGIKIPDGTNQETGLL